MRELEIRLSGRQCSGERVVRVDDESLKLKKNKFGNYVGTYQTEKDRVTVKVYNLLDVGGVLWFLTQIFFFLISIFGIFDIHRKEKCLKMDFEAEVELKEENKITLQVNLPKENEKAITVQTELPNREITNNFYLDIRAKKTLKLLLAAKIITAIAVIATVVAVVVVKIIG